MHDLILAFFRATAWPMEAPLPYRAFHIGMTLIGAGSSFLLAHRLSRSRHGPPSLQISMGKCPKAYSTLALCGLLLALSELYKQGFLYCIVNNFQYDWWYFPFQLCSVPMYLCLTLPLLHHLRLERACFAVCTFLQDFALLGGIMALAEPSGLMHPYWTLTIHGFLWHFMLIFIGLFCCLSGCAWSGVKSFIKTIPLFLACCAIATAINVASHPLGNADMFYISPYYPSAQVVFHQIALRVGVHPGNLIYLTGVCLGAFLCHMGASALQSRGRIIAPAER